jgi:uncharacterized lipoprotein YehR (DUF1307 family)
MKIIFVALILSVSLSGCDSPQEDCYKKNYKNYVNKFSNTTDKVKAIASSEALKACPK